MKLLKYLLYAVLAIVIVVIVIAIIAGVRSAKFEIQQSHDTPYITAGLSAAVKPTREPLWQVLLLGDAGDSTLQPWHPTLSLASKLASSKPEKTTVLMLGDNIYLSGYPDLADGETEYSAEQKLLIDRLNAQLQIAQRSDAELFLVPGNHDWYADQVDTQATHVANYAKQHNARVEFVPWSNGNTPLPQIAHRSGLSMVFLDSQWLLAAEQQSFDEMITHLSNTLRTIETDYPNNVILVAAHHPLQTMGPHAQYYTSRSYSFVMELINLFFDVDQDLHNPPYQKLINGLGSALDGNPKIIYAAGHEHSLQIFKQSRPGPKFQLVSGAANQSKVSGVGHNEDTQFAVSAEGFMRLSVYPQGPFLEVFSTETGTVIHSQWLK